MHTRITGSEKMSIVTNCR